MCCDTIYFRQMTGESALDRRWQQWEVYKKGNVDASGAKREVSAELIENLEPGDYVMVHAGIAIAKITEEDEDEAEDLLEGLLWKNN